MSMLYEVNNAFKQSIEEVIGADMVELFCAPANPRFGDYQCNAAIQIFKTLSPEKKKEYPTPKDLAAKIAEVVEKDCSVGMFDSLTVAPQGFITVKMKSSYLQTQILNWYGDFRLKLCNLRPLVNKHKSVALDFSSPNIAKAMHVGHLRSTIIGDSIGRILEELGYNVLRINHFGDWGTQFGMIIQYLSEIQFNYDEEVNMEALTAYYKASKERFDNDLEFKRASQQTVVHLQSGDKELIEKWKRICGWSKKGFDEIYRRLNIKIEGCGESFYNSRLPIIVEELKNKEVVIESEGALCLFTKLGNPPLMVVKSDGGYTYDTTDLAALKYRINELGVDWLIYVVDSGQSDHLQRIFEAGRMLGWIEEPLVEIQHVNFGVVLGDDGKRFKTRSGDTVGLLSLLNEAGRRVYERARDDAIENGSDAVSDASLSYYEKVGYGCVKFYDLKQNRQSAYKFSYDKMLEPRGYTAIYIMYGIARIRGIYEKMGKTPEDIKLEELSITNAKERTLSLHLLRFGDAVLAAIRGFLLNRICDYIYELTAIFMDFYEGCRIQGHPNETSRLSFCELTRRTLTHALELVGIDPVDRL